MEGILLDFELNGAMCKMQYRLGKGGVKCNKPIKLLIVQSNDIFIID